MQDDLDQFFMMMQPQDPAYAGLPALECCSASIFDRQGYQQLATGQPNINSSFPLWDPVHDLQIKQQFQLRNSDSNMSMSDVCQQADPRSSHLGSELSCGESAAGFPFIIAPQQVAEHAAYCPAPRHSNSGDTSHSQQSSLSETVVDVNSGGQQQQQHHQKGVGVPTAAVQEILTAFRRRISASQQGGLSLADQPPAEGHQKPTAPLKPVVLAVTPPCIHPESAAAAASPRPAAASPPARQAAQAPAPAAAHHARGPHAVKIKAEVVEGNTDSDDLDEKEGKHAMSHSTVEKQRRDRLNTLIDVLADMVPATDTKYRADGPGSQGGCGVGLAGV